MNFSDYLQQHHDIRKDFNYPHSSPGCVLQLTIHAFSLLSQMISLFHLSFPRYVPVLAAALYFPFKLPFSLASNVLIPSLD